MDCQASYGFAKDWPPLITMSMSTASLPACGAALSMCTATNDLIVHAIIVLGVIDGILLVFCMGLLGVFYSGSLYDKRGLGQVREGAGSAGLVVEKSGLPEPPDVGHGARDGLTPSPEPRHPSKPVLPSPPEPCPPSKPVLPSPPESCLPSKPVLPPRLEFLPPSPPGPLDAGHVAKDVLPSPPEIRPLSVLAEPPDAGHASRDVIPSPPESRPPSVAVPPTASPIARDVLPSPPGICPPPVVGLPDTSYDTRDAIPSPPESRPPSAAVPPTINPITRDVLPSPPEICPLPIAGPPDTSYDTRDAIPSPPESRPPSVAVPPTTSPIARDLLPSPPEFCPLPVAGSPDTSYDTRDAIPSPPESHPPSVPRPPTTSSLAMRDALPSLPGFRPSVPKPQVDVGEKRKDRTLPRVPSVTSLSASLDDRQTQRSSLESDAMSFRSGSNSSTLSLAAISVNDFDQGEDEELHPGIYRLVTEGRFSKEAVGRLAPIPPKPGTVIAGYNPSLDEARPQTINEYLNKYRIFFVVDDSRSMVRHWTETEVALSEIANYALMNYSDAVDIRFFNSRERKCGVQGAEQVVDIFKSVSRSAGTPTGRVLQEVLSEQLDRLDKAHERGEYSSERPLDVIVLTDGVPNVDSPPAPVIEGAAARLNASKHHQNWIGIQFVQIGGNPKAEPTLLSLIDCENNNHMVDTVSYSFYKNKGGGKLTSQILERIVLGGLHPNLRSYYNQYRKKVSERTSRVIY